MHKLYINPLPVRIWHWTNAVGFCLLILTGLQIRYLDLIPILMRGMQEQQIEIFVLVGLCAFLMAWCVVLTVILYKVRRGCIRN